MSITDTENLLTASPPPSSVRLRATDVTEMLEIEAELPRNVPAAAVAQTLAQRLELPADVPWALRDERGTFLEDEREIGEQLPAAETEARVTLTPRTHLG